VDHIAKFVSNCLALRLKYNFSATSWGRTSKRNADVGGVPGSCHLMWTGLDVVFDDMKRNVDFEKDASKVGLTAVYENDHYHLQPKEVS